jgi:peptidoglycan-associated lipoprotein
MAFSCSKYIAVAALSVVVAGCGDDAKPTPKTPGGGVTGATSATSTAKQMPVVPPTPENVPNTETASGVKLDDRIRKACGITDQEAYFAFDSSVVQTNDHPVLDKVAVCFTSGPLKGQGMRLVGHADPRGPADYNRILGQKRADAVQGYLLGHGMTKAKCDSTTRGADDATGTDEVGWAKDRRVDVMLSE